MQSSNKHGSSAMASIICPTNGYRGAQSAKGIKPKNHMVAHRQSLRKQEEGNKQRKDDMNNTKSKYQLDSANFLLTVIFFHYSWSIRHEAISKRWVESSS